MFSNYDFMVGEMVEVGAEPNSLGTYYKAKNKSLFFVTAIVAPVDGEHLGGIMLAGGSHTTPAQTGPQSDGKVFSVATYGGDCTLVIGADGIWKQDFAPEFSGVPGFDAAQYEAEMGWLEMLGGLSVVPYHHADAVGGCEFDSPQGVGQMGGYLKALNRTTADYSARPTLSVAWQTADLGGRSVQVPTVTILHDDDNQMFVVN